ncbi:MAG TPA: FtsX-like permease family protein [Beijerinckia sp.]|jgi:putative ABC transport system permease protein|nr:FtsX-like permease family protein [Beijerinckia sp.]
MPTTNSATPRPPSRWPLVLRIALRDFRGGLRGFGVFLACIALGVAAISGVGAVSRALGDGLARQGRTILGGDVSFELIQRELSEAEQSFLAAHGKLSRVAVMRAMARSESGDTALVEIKAVDQSYPAPGEIGLDPPQDLSETLAEKNGAYGMAADAALLVRLNLKVGDRLEIGDARFDLRATITNEPDRLAGGIGFGPRVLMSEAALRATGLVVPGSLVRWLNRVSLGGTNAQASDGEVSDFVEAAQKTFPQAGWEVRTRQNVSPQFSRNLERFTEFLTLVGLTSLIIGGVGVANAIRGYVERKKPVIATLKSLGATGSYVFVLMLAQVMLVALLGMALGAVIGAAMPFIAAAAFGSLLAFPLAPAIYPGPIAAGFVYGTLTALVFSLGPLGRAHDVSVSALFRDQIEPNRALPRKRYLFMMALAAASLGAVVIGLATDRRLVLIYMGATLAAFALLRIVALLIMMAAKRLPHARQVSWRLAIANIHRPGALTPSVVLSLGLGLALLVALTLIDGNLHAELDHLQPGQTPSFFFVGVPSGQAQEFQDFLKSRAAEGRLELVPMLRGRIVKLKGQPAEAAKPKEDAAWALQGDRGITFSRFLPEGSQLVSGAWWPQDYSGPPLVSLESDVAEGLGLAVGDVITVNVLGREIEARIANTRKVNWRSFGMNFVLVFTPSSFTGAPHSDLATLTFPNGGEKDKELALLRETARLFPAITSIRVKDALDAVNALVGQLALAVRGASSIALLASILVLGGALAAGQQARVHDAVILKTLGATRGRLLAAFLLEYGLIGLCTAIFGVAAGGAAAYAITVRVMKLDFLWLWPQALLVAASALVLTILLGLLGTWRILGRKPAPYLRDL